MDNVSISRDWFHALVEKQQSTEELKKLTVKASTITHTFSICTFFNFPKLDQNQSKIYLWHDISKDVVCHDSLVSSAESFFQKTIPKCRIYSPKHQGAENYKKFFTQALKRPLNQRILFFIYDHDMSVIHGNKVLINDKRHNIHTEYVTKNLIQDLGPKSIIIADSTNSGALLNDIRSSSNDIIAFLSNRTGQKLPIIPNIPSDIFTSCMLTAPKVVLYLHSQRSFYLRNSPGKSISLETEIPAPIYNEVNLELKHVVESIAFRTLNHDLFMKLFRSDPTVNQLAVNFVYACRICSQYEVTPMSYPEIPDMSSDLLWNEFEMKLDFIIAKMVPSTAETPHSPQIHILQSFENHIRTLSAPNWYIDEVSFLSMLLSSPDVQIRERSISALAKYLNSSPEAVMISLHFQVVQSVFRTFIQRPTPEVIFCLTKFGAFAPNICCEIVDHMEGFIPTLLQQFESSPFSVTFALMIVRASEKIKSKFLPSDWEDSIFALIEGPSEGRRMPAMLFLGEFLSTYPKLIDRILRININELGCESIAAFVEYIPVIADFKPSDEVIDLILELMISMSSVVRRKIAEIIYQLQGKFSCERIIADLRDDIDPQVIEAIQNLENKTESLASEYSMMFLRSLTIGSDSISVKVHPKKTPKQNIPQKTTSNVTFLDSTSYVYGTEDGRLAYHHIDINKAHQAQAKRIQRYEIDVGECFQIFDQNTPVTSTAVLPNGGDPLFIAGNSHRHCKIITGDGQTRTHFKLDLYRSCEDEYSISVQPLTSTMIVCSRTRLHPPLLFDIATERRFNQITKRRASVCAQSTVYPSIVALGHKSKLSFHDVRISDRKVAISVQLSSEVIGATMTTGALVGLRSGNIVSIDLRCPRPFLVKKTERESTFFGAGLNVCAIGCEDSVTLFNDKLERCVYSRPGESGIRSISCPFNGDNLVFVDNDGLIINEFGFNYTKDIQNV